MTDLAEAAATELRTRTGINNLDIAMVLGSGWGATADRLGEPVATVAAFAREARASTTTQDQPR